MAYPNLPSLPDSTTNVLIHHDTLRYLSILTANFVRSLNNKTINLYIFLIFINDTYDRMPMTIFIFFKKKVIIWLQGLTYYWITGKNFKFLAYNVLLTHAYLGSHNWSSFPLTPVPWGYWKHKPPYISTHVTFFAWILSPICTFGIPIHTSRLEISITSSWCIPWVSHHPCIPAPSWVHFATVFVTLPLNHLHTCLFLTTFGRKNLDFLYNLRT